MRPRKLAFLAVMVALVAGRAVHASPDAGALDAAVAASAPVDAAAGEAGAADAALLPPQHPPVNGGSPHDDQAQRDPRREAADLGIFIPPADTVEEDPASPPGTITVDVRDVDDKPVAGQEVTLGILVQSIAKGESRKHERKTTDERGRAVFGHLDPSQPAAYRITVARDGGAFAAMPFRLEQDRAIHAVVHVFPVIREMNAAGRVVAKDGSTTFQNAIMIATEIAAEVRDDRIQFEEMLSVVVLGKSAWVPQDFIVPLPEDFTALTSNQGMSDQGVDAVDKKGVHLRGTFPPSGVARHLVSFRWQIPWSNDEVVTTKIGLPPRAIAAGIRVMAIEPMKIGVDGFPPAKPDPQMPGFLRTEKKLGATNVTATFITLTLRDLPTIGSGRLVAVALASLGVAIGIAFAFGRGRARVGTTAGDPAAVRAQLLEELEELERARRAGDVGPRTYEQARRQIIDAIARTLGAQAADAQPT